MTTSQLVGLGYDVVVERGAGVAAAETDEAYAEAGAVLGSAADVLASDIVIKVETPTDAEIAELNAGTVVVSQLAPARSPELLERIGGLTVQRRAAV